MKLFHTVLIFLVTVSLSAETMRNRIRIKKSSELIVNDNNSEEFEIEKAQLLAKKRQGLINDIHRVLREAHSDIQKTELGLRLGSLYMEDYHALQAQAQVKNPSKPDLSQAKASLERSIGIYRSLLSQHPSGPRRAEILYFLAVAALDKDQSVSAMSYFNQLAAMASRYQADAQIQLGDHYFDKNQYGKAGEYYDQIIRAKNPKLLSYAVYKKAWCLYNEQKFEASIRHFKWVAKSNTRDTVRIKNEAIRDIALPFVELKLVDEAVKFYSIQDSVQSRQGLEIVADALKEKGSYLLAVSLYDRLISIDPNHKKNPQYEIAAIESFRLLNRHRDAIERLFSRFALYGENSNWFELNSSDPKTVKDLHSQFEETARQYALQHHAEGQKTNNQALYSSAKALYAKYLEHFPLSQYAPKIRFYLAEILFKENQYLAASDEYYQIFKNPSAGPLKMDGLRYALASLDRLVNDDRKKQGLPSTDSTSKLKMEGSGELLPYSDTETRFLKFGDEYLKTYASQKDVPLVLYEQNYLRYSHYDLEKAQKGFWNLIQQFPKDPSSRSAAFLVLDIFNRKTDYPGLISVCKTFLGHKDLGKGTFKTEVAAVLRQAELKQISLIEEQGNFKEAAARYIEFTRAYGPLDESLFEKALYNASVNFTKAELFPPAVETQERFLRRFPKSTLRENMLLSVARTHEMLTNFDKAALFYEEFAKDYSEHPQAKQALRLAGIYYWGSGHTRQAEGIFNDYQQRYPSDEKLITQDLLDLYESAGLVDKQIQFYLQARAVKGLSAADYLSYSLKIADLQLTRKGKLSPSLTQEINRAATLFRKDLLKSPKGIEALSRVAFSQVSPIDATFHRIHLTSNQIEKRLKDKLKFLKQLENEYMATTKLGSLNWGLAAMYRTALAYHQMALEVSQAPVPSELSSDELDIYRAELNKEMIVPFTDKAKVLAKTCLEKSMEHNISSVWAPRCYSLASTLDPKVYVPARTFYLPPLQVGLSLPQSGKTKLGEILRFSYPYYSSFLFSPPSIERNLTAISEQGDKSDGSMPSLIDYRTLSDERRAILTKLFNDEKPSENDLGSFAYLNLARLLNPAKAVPLIQKAIASDPKNSALHNLLALAYLEQNQATPAKVTLLSLIARGEKSAPVLNNLGVISYLEGKEMVATQYWNEAILLGNSKEASLNLGFYALKFHNGFEAKKHFERFQEDKDATAQVGIAVACLQNLEMENARDKFADLYRTFKSDPYARLSTSYFLLDVEAKPAAAQALLNDYLDFQNGDTPEIRRALAETKRSVDSMSGSVGLPTIGQ